MEEKFSIEIAKESHPEVKRRLDALEIVIERIKQDPNAIRKLTRMEQEGNDVQVFLPVTMGQVQLIRKSVKFLLYLGPELETLDSDIIVMIIAHEWAHIVLEHKFEGLTKDEQLKQEVEGWVQVKEWGFEKRKKYDEWVKSQENK